jgi:hypothetical protein
MERDRAAAHRRLFGYRSVCSILFDCHNQRSYGVNYYSPNGSIHFKTSMTGFVDNTKGQTNDMSLRHVPMPLAQLIAQMQADAQLWGNLLHVSGSTLEIPKCNYYYVMSWKFKSSGIPKLDSDIEWPAHWSIYHCYKGNLIHKKPTIN